MTARHESVLTQINGPHLVVEPLGDDLVIYDRLSHRAHLLHARAAAVWRAAGEDGFSRRPPSPAGDVAATEEEALTELAISELVRAGLLRSDAPPPVVPRRGILKALGVAALPMVVSILAPASAAAVTVCDGSIMQCTCGDACLVAGVTLCQPHNGNICTCTSGLADPPTQRCCIPSGATLIPGLGLCTGMTSLICCSGTCKTAPVDQCT